MKSSCSNLKLAKNSQLFSSALLLLQLTGSHFPLQGKRQTWYNSTLASRRKRLTAHFEDLEQCYFSNKMSRITGTTDIAKNICTLSLLLLAAKHEYLCNVVELCSSKVCIVRKNWTTFEWGMEKENKNIQRMISWRFRPQCGTPSFYQMNIKLSQVAPWLQQNL